MSQNNDDRRWSYEDYESNRARSRARSPLAAIGVALLVLVLLAIVALSVYGVYSAAKYRAPALPGSPESSQEQTAPVESSEAGSVSESAPAAPESSGEQSLTILGRSSSSEPEKSKELTTVEIVEKVRPSVVDVLIYRSYDTIRAAGEGSGVIMTEDGYIITNAHVISSAAAVTVTLSDGSSYPAEIIGFDEKTDLGVLKIDAVDLPVAEFGNSDELRVGERVLTIGNPGGSVLAGSVAQGIVSGINRSLSNDSYATSYIQTDAAINPGNSGGALVDAYGKVVGINSAKISSVAYEGIGFAIPINEALPVLQDLISYGHVTGRARLGVTAQTIDESLSRINNIPTGVYVFSTDEGADISEKGVERGDIITNVDGERIEGLTDLGNILARHKPGDTVTLTVYRPSYGAIQADETFEVDVVLIEDAG